MVDETHDKMLLPFVLTISLGILLSVDDVTRTSPVSVGSQLMSKYKNLGKSVSLYWTMYTTATLSNSPPLQTRIDFTLKWLLAFLTSSAQSFLVYFVIW